VKVEFPGPSGREIEHVLCASELLWAKAGDAARVCLRIPRHRRASERRLQAAPVEGTNLLAAGREVAEWIAAAPEKTQDAFLVIERKLGKIAPPAFAIHGRVGPTLAGRLDDERVFKRDLLLVGHADANDQLTGDDLRATPADARKQQWLAHPMFPFFAATCPSFYRKSGQSARCA
jgi:hypothetical protein